MIGYIEGTIILRRTQSVIILTGGVGYEVVLSLYTFGKVSVGESVSFNIYTHVRDYAIVLFGFSDAREKDFFEMLISVSGIGPKAALGILSVSDVSTIASGIAAKDVSLLTKVSGIGKRTAERVVVELSGKVGKFAGGENKKHGGDSDALDALVSMGYSLSEARDAISAVPGEITNLSDRVRAALKVVGKMRE